MSADSESHDDVAGLFKRLGRRDDTRQYHDFSGAPALPGKKATTPVSADAQAPVIPPPVPAPTAPVTTAPTAVQADHATASAASPAMSVLERPSTSLHALFQRLLKAPLRPSVQSPLARLRTR